MGYETRMIVGLLTEKTGKEKHGYIQVLAEIDLCKTHFSNVFDETDKAVTCYFYKGSSRKVVKDLYGDPLYAIPAGKVLTQLKFYERVEPYRRYRAAIGLLEPMIQDFSKEKLVCVLFGH